MATSHTTLTQAWTEIGTGLTVLVLQPAGDVDLHIGASAPAASDPGFRLCSGLPVEVPSLSALGGGAWARAADRDLCGLTYASA